MTTVFPGAIDAFSTKVDGVTDVLAAHVNDLQDSVVAVETVVIAQAPNPNLLYHTLSHDIWPEGVTFNDVADDTYVAGLWNALHNGQNPDVSGEALAIAGSKRAIKCLFDSASSQAGFVQFLSSEDTLPLRGKILSFSIDASTFNVSNMRCAILEWVGTADTITSDVVATWGAGNPTLATSWSYIGTPADQAISGTTRIKAEGKVIGATTNNLAVFIWNPALEASTDFFRLANAKLEIGLTATAFVAPGLIEEQIRVKQFYQKSYPIGTGPATASSNGYLTMEGFSTSVIVGNALYQPEMRTTPTVIIYSYAGTINKASNLAGADVGTTVTGGANSTKGLSTVNDSGTGFVAGTKYLIHYTADARL